MARPQPEYEKYVGAAVICIKPSPRGASLALQVTPDGIIEDLLCKADTRFRFKGIEMLCDFNSEANTLAMCSRAYISHAEDDGHGAYVLTISPKKPRNAPINITAPEDTGPLTNPHKIG